MTSLLGVMLGVILLTGHRSRDGKGGAGGQPGDHRSLWFKGVCISFSSTLSIDTSEHNNNPLTSTRICNVSHKHHLCTHCRPFWMPCRTKQRPAAPSLVSSGWDSTPPSWWPTALTSTPGPLSPTHPDTSGPQMGESRGRDAFQFNIKQNSLGVIQQPCLSLTPSAPECLRSLKPAGFNREQRSCCTLRTTAKSFPPRTE